MYYEGNYFLTDNQMECLCYQWMPAAVASYLLSHNKMVMQDYVEIPHLKTQVCFYSPFIPPKEICLNHHHNVSC